MIKLTILGLIIFVASCQLKHDNIIKNNDTVFVTVLTISNRIKSKDTTLLKIDEYLNKRVFNYIDLNPQNKMLKSDTFSITIFNNQDSFILFRQDTCFLFKRKDYTINRGELKINKYIYDEKHTMDEEAEFLINDSLGIIRIYSLAWNNYVIYKRKLKLYNQIDSCINMDSSIFVRRLNNSEAYFNQFKD